MPRQKGYLTVEGIARAKPRAGDRWLTEQEGQRGHGRLVVRITPKGARVFYFRYTVADDGMRVQLPLGPFTVEPADGALTLTQARAKRGEYQEIYREHGDLRLYFKRQEEARLEAETQARHDRERDATLTLRALMGVYEAALEARGKKRSAQDVRNLCKVHLRAYGAIPAREITVRDVTAILRGVVEAGKGRTAAKLRSYMRAAYALAVRADRDPAAPSAFIAFGLTENPVEHTDSLAQFTKARDRVLSQSELAAFWKRLDGVTSDPVQAAVRLALLLGGQRPAQLLRLEREDVDLQGRTIRLFDPKGRRSDPRVHELPLTDAAVAVLESLLDRAKKFGCAWLFTADGDRRLHPDTVTAQVRYISTDMRIAGEAKADFQLRDLRRTCETMLAAMSVSRDVRAQLLSHGLTGVQHVHYDRHDYAAEKRAALERWTQRLLGGGGVVIPLGKAAA